MNSLFDDVIDFLKLSYPDGEGILIGCRAESCNSYECCEYDIIVFESKKNEYDDAIKKNKYNFFQVQKKKLKVFLFDKENFIHNKEIHLQKYIILTNSIFKRNLVNFFEKKKNYDQKNFKILTKRKLLQFTLDWTTIHKQILNDSSSQNLSLYYLNMLSFNILELFVQLFSNKIPSPSHLKYQINTIKEINPKIKEQIDTLSGYLELDRSNVSTITRSEKSLISLFNNNTCHNLEIEIFYSKLRYFKTKSMYVDANLLIHSFLKKQNFDINYIRNYNKLLNYILDIQSKDTILVLKELDLLFNVVKNFVKNSY